VGEVARDCTDAGQFCGAWPLLLLLLFLLLLLLLLLGGGGCGGLGSLEGHRRRTGFDIIPYGDLLTGLLGLFAHNDIFEAILRYINFCAYIGKDPPIKYSRESGFTTYDISSGSSPLEAQFPPETLIDVRSLPH
jgi:hypothetical protein